MAHGTGVNPHEEVARLRKASRLADTLAALHVDADTLEAQDEIARARTAALAAVVAGTKAPSAATTGALAATRPPSGPLRSGSCRSWPPALLSVRAVRPSQAATWRRRVLSVAVY
jgi:hypothetical protein